MQRLKRNYYGFSLIEILVVLAVLAIVGVTTTQTLFLILRAQRKAEANVRVRENLNYALAVIERQLHSATKIDSDCDGMPSERIDFKDQRGESASFSCQDLSTTGYIASGSANARLTSSQLVDVTSCSFTCTQSGFLPEYIDVSLQGSFITSQAEEGSIQRVSTRIYLRSY